jgi:P-type Cu+ transporter
MSRVTSPGMNNVIDPVCGMKVDPDKAVGSSAYEGQKYYFCSRGCETKFDADPKKYTSADYKPSGMAH